MTKKHGGREMTNKHQTFIGKYGFIIFCVIFILAAVWLFSRLAHREEEPLPLSPASGYDY